MHTFQIAESVLDGYRNTKLSEERINFLKQQAQEQLEEIATDKELYESFVSRVNPPDDIDPLILWSLLMSQESIVEDYIDAFNKLKYREIIPVSDLADILLYAIHLKKVKDITLDGFDFLLEFEQGGMDEVDQYAFSNVLLYVEKSKQPEIEF